MTPEMSESDQKSISTAIYDVFPERIVEGRMVDDRRHVIAHLKQVIVPGMTSATICSIIDLFGKKISDSQATVCIDLMAQFGTDGSNSR